MGGGPTHHLLRSSYRAGASAQGFIAFILWGVGAFFGTMLAGRVLAAHKLPIAVGSIEHDWRGIWMTPAYLATAVLVVFLIFFREPRRAGAAAVAVAADGMGVEPGTP
ncbi:MAG: hypothetical protein ABIP55_00670 [Tepidisphaeraceae bacterium]